MHTYMLLVEISWLALYRFLFAVTVLILYAINYFGSGETRKM